ncbi:MAG TPA: winged helix-turn-helix domain-containing protein [Methanothrix sp.]|nr:winged helix-turn-helix domain-containing protein [Methanothrix sp.]
MAETYQLKDILERFERSQRRLDRDEHFEAYCMLKLAGMNTHVDREEMLKILQIINQGHVNGLPPFTEPEIAKRTGLSINNVRRYVDKLSREGAIDRISIGQEKPRSGQTGRPPLFACSLNREFYEAWSDQAPHRLRSEAKYSMGIVLRNETEEDRKIIEAAGIGRCSLCGHPTSKLDLIPNSNGEDICKSCAKAKK